MTIFTIAVQQHNRKSGGVGGLSKTILSEIIEKDNENCDLLHQRIKQGKNEMLPERVLSA